MGGACHSGAEGGHTKISHGGGAALRDSTRTLRSGRSQVRAAVSVAACGDGVVVKFNYGSETTMWGAQSRRSVRLEPAMR